MNELTKKNKFTADLKGMDVSSFAVDFIVDQNVAGRRDSKLSSSAFQAVREHGVVNLTSVI